MFQLDEVNGLIVDEMGLPTSTSDVQLIAAMCKRHLKKSELELEALARRLVQKHCPRMENQINWEAFK